MQRHIELGCMAYLTLIISISVFGTSEVGFDVSEEIYTPNGQIASGPGVATAKLLAQLP